MHCCIILIQLTGTRIHLDNVSVCCEGKCSNTSSRVAAMTSIQEVLFDKPTTFFSDGITVASVGPMSLWLRVTVLTVAVPGPPEGTLERGEGGGLLGEMRGPDA